jgi:hypothetical protein
LTEKGQKAACQIKKHHGKYRKNCLLSLQVMMQMGEMKAMLMMMGENQSSQSQVHVKAFRGAEG